jgi:hypothetical protein
VKRSNSVLKKFVRLCVLMEINLTSLRCCSSELILG